MTVVIGEADPHLQTPEFRKNFEVELSTFHVEPHDEQFNDVRALGRRSESRIATLSEELSRSRADLESTSARFNQLAGEIPVDVAGLSDQLSRILNAATAEADGIRAEARQFAEAVRAEAEERATRIISETQLEYESVTALRADLEAQSKQIRADVARLREQAALNAANIMSEAKDTAEEMLARAQRDIDAQLAVAQANLDELIEVRANIASQLRDFYRKFNQLDGCIVPTDPTQTICLVSDSSELGPGHGAHAAVEADLTQQAFRSIG